MGSKKLLFIYNPFSGMGKVRHNLADIIDELVAGGYEVTVHPTQGKEDATKIAEQCGGNYDQVVCCGGDGTLDETVTGVLRGGNETLLGYIPAGSTNDFANSLGLPKDMKKAAEIAVTGDVFRSDIGRFGDDTFVYVAAFGVFTDVSYETSQNLKNIFGHAAYILEGAKRLGTYESYHMRVEYDGQQIEDDFIYGMISNSESVGGFKGMTGNHVQLDDGVFEVTLIKAPHNPVELNEIIAYLTGLKDDSNLIYAFKTGEISFYPYTEIPWTLDGEFGGNQTQITIKIDRRALPIRVPKQEGDMG